MVIDYAAAFTKAKKDTLSKISNADRSLNSIYNLEEQMISIIAKQNKINLMITETVDEMNKDNEKALKKELEYVKDVLVSKIERYSTHQVKARIDEPIFDISSDRLDVDSNGVYKYIMEKEKNLNIQDYDKNYRSPFTFVDVSEGIKKVLSCDVRTHRSKTSKNITSQMIKRNKDLKNLGNANKSSNRRVANTFKKLKRKTELNKILKGGKKAVRKNLSNSIKSINREIKNREVEHKAFTERANKRVDFFKEMAEKHAKSKGSK